jgi:DNA-binding GntR family transcriptional regulator
VHVAGEDAPKYRQLADDLRTRIRSGEYAPGAQVPSKAVLMTTRNLSLGTVNKAIDILVGEGLLFTEQGSGTFVCDPLPEQARSEYEIVMGEIGDLRGEVRQLREEVAAMRQAMEA